MSATYFLYAVRDEMVSIVETWENTLETNDDDYIYVDGEEGDYGVVTHWGANAAGERVMMLVQFIHGGDDENTYYTQEGVDAVCRLFSSSAISTDFVRKALMNQLAPVKEQGLFIGYAAFLKTPITKVQEDAQ